MGENNLESHRIVSFVTTGRQPALLVDLALRDSMVRAVSRFLQDISKLKPRFVRPFRAIKAVRANIFELDLPTAINVHPLFNFSLLCKFQGDYRPPKPIIVDGEAE